jgi:hypothetical protein
MTVLRRIFEWGGFLGALFVLAGLVGYGTTLAVLAAASL